MDSYGIRTLGSEPRRTDRTARYLLILKHRNGVRLDELQFRYHTVEDGLAAYRSFQRYMSRDWMLRLSDTAHTGEDHVLVFGIGSYEYQPALGPR